MLRCGLAWLSLALAPCCGASAPLEEIIADVTSQVGAKYGRSFTLILGLSCWETKQVEETHLLYITVTGVVLQIAVASFLNMDAGSVRIEALICKNHLCQNKTDAPMRLPSILVAQAIVTRAMNGVAASAA